MYNKVYAAMKKAVDAGAAAGVNLLVYKDGKEALYCEYGYRDLENKIPMSRDTIVRFYSMSKPITSAAVMKLVADGLVELSAPVSDYLPEFAQSYVNVDGMRRPVVKPICVDDLMHMASGLPYADEFTASGLQMDKLFNEIDRRLYTDDPVSTAEFAKMASKVDLLFEPGTQFRYGISADVLGALVERVSGMSFGEFLKKNIFEPLDMKDTAFYVPAEKADRLAKVYEYGENGLQEIKTNWLGLRYMRDIPPAFESGGAGLCGTIDDYAKFGLMLMNNGTYNGQQVLPQRIVRFMCRGGLDEVQKQQLWAGWSWLRGYSYGNLMRVCEEENHTHIVSSKGEYGWDGWLGTFFSNEPEHGITMVVTTQLTGIGDTGTLTRKLKSIVMGELA